jgi:hypothetical protein
MKYLLASLIILFTGCKSAEKLAAQKAAKEDVARKERIQLMQDARKAYPCDTVTKYYVDTLEKVLPGDTTVINDTVYIRLPGKDITHTKVQTIIDRIEVEKLTMQLESMQYAAQLQAEENIEQDETIMELKEKNIQLKDYQVKLLAAHIGMAILILVYIFIKIKGLI